MGCQGNCFGVKAGGMGGWGRGVAFGWSSRPYGGSLSCVSCRVCADDDRKVKPAEWVAGNAHSPSILFSNTLSLLK